MDYTAFHERQRERYAEREKRGRRTARLFKVWLLINLFLLVAMTAGAISYYLTK